MNLDQKTELARRLLDAKGEKTSPPSKPGFPEKLLGMSREIHRRRFEVLAELYAKYYEESELAAELEFYESDVGRSIVQARRRILEDLQKLLPQRLKDLDRPSSSSSGGIGLRSWPPPDEQSPE